MTVIDVLRGALADLEVRGWGQGFGLLPDGRICAQWAIHGAAGCTEDADLSERVPPTPARALANDAAAAVLDAVGVAAIPKQLVDWNDAEGRTVEEVIAAFRGAIARLESKP